MACPGTHAGIRACVAGNEFGVFVDVDVVLIAVVVLPALLCPACVCVFVRQFIGLIGILAPLNRYSTCFDECVALAPIALDGYRHKGGVYDLTAFELDALLAGRSSAVRSNRFIITSRTLSSTVLRRSCLVELESTS